MPMSCKIRIDISIPIGRMDIVCIVIGTWVYTKHDLCMCVCVRRGWVHWVVVFVSGGVWCVFLSSSFVSFDCILLFISMGSFRVLGHDSSMTTTTHKQTTCYFYNRPILCTCYNVDVFSLSKTHNNNNNTGRWDTLSIFTISLVIAIRITYLRMYRKVV